MIQMKKLTALVASVGLSIALIGCQHDHGNAPEPTPAPEPRPLAPAPAPAQAPAAAPAGDGLRYVSMAYPTGDRATSVVLVEKGMPGEVSVGAPFDYKLRVTNLSRLTLDNVMLTDTVGEGFEVISADPTYTDANGGKLRWAFAKLAPGETKTISVKGRATRVGTIGSCAEVTYNSALCATIPVVEPKLQLVKTLTPEVLACDPIVATFTVTNPGTGVARNVKIVDNLPQGLVTAEGGRAVNVMVGDLGPGQSKQATVALKAAGKGTYNNTATATADGGLSVEAKSTTVVKKPELAIACEADKSEFIGRDVTASATLRNTGDGVAKNTVVTATLPAGVAFKSATAGGTLNGNVVTWNVPAMAAGSTGKFDVTYSSSNSGTYSVAFAANAYCADPVSSACPTDIQGIPAILLEVVDTDPVQVGNTTTYTITVTNQGSAPGTKIELDATLEAEMEFVSGSGPTPVTGSGRTVDLGVLPTLAPGAKAEWKIVVKALAPGDVRFKLSMTEARLTRPVEETEATNFYK
jgi:uncharacterized repeat protein (TIGR01451 family)